MASNFNVTGSVSIGTSAVQVGSYTPGAGVKTVVLSLILSNKLTSDITVSAWHYNATANTTLITNAPVAAGESLALQKIVMAANNKLWVSSNTASSVDATLSYLEIT